MTKADLHTHTIFSDGVLTPEELIIKAKENGITVLAVTDHDTIEGANIAKDIAGDYDIDVIIGCEFSTEYEGNEIHVLGYGLDAGDSQLDEFLKISKVNRKIRAGLICEKLQNLGFDISLSEVEMKAEGASIGRPHIASVMLEKGYVEKIQDAFDKYIGDGRPAYQKKILSPNKDVFEIIKKSGGISSLAHPEKTISQTKIYDLVRNGLAGIEIIHPYITEYRTKSLRMRAKQYGLYVTGGSDYHGIKSYEEYNFGKYYLDKDNLQKLLIRIKPDLFN
jgi:predicted metal-dependent phosphoesterase TrpH